MNSKFTLSRVLDAFPSLRSRITEADVMYPPVSTASADQFLAATEGKSRLSIATDLPQELRALMEPNAPGTKGEPFILVSINRFETKKNIPLALRAFAACGRLAPGFQQKGVLVLAGGYDSRNTDNVSCMAGLQKEARQLGVEDRVVFMPSFSSAQKEQLLRVADVLLYTPSGEHFGIVPFASLSLSLLP